MSKKIEMRKFAVASFADEDLVKAAIKKIQEAGIAIHDVFMPYPAHGVEPLLNMKRSRLPKAAFWFGVFGFCFALSLISYTMIIDWPMDIGGKPNTYPTVAYVPVCFELTVLCASFGMGFTFFGSTSLFPGSKPVIFNERSTDDRFVVVVELDGTNNSSVLSTLKSVDAAELEEVEKEAKLF